MTVTASGLFIATFMDALDTTQLALDLDLETHKGALYANTITPNFSDTAANAAFGAGAFASGEVTGTNWPTGGVALVGTTLADSPAGTLMLDATDVSVAGTTLTGARCYLLYADALAGNNAIVLVNFGADFATVNGTFGIQWAAGGYANIDLTP
jgi:hypothetical protein